MAGRNGEAEKGKKKDQGKGQGKERDFNGKMKKGQERVEEVASRYRISCLCAVLSRFSHVRLFATPWAVASQAPLSVEFSRQEY